MKSAAFNFRASELSILPSISLPLERTQVKKKEFIFAMWIIKKYIKEYARYSKYS